MTTPAAPEWHERTDIMPPDGHYVSTSRTSGTVRVRLVPVAPRPEAVDTCGPRVVRLAEEG